MLYTIKRLEPVRNEAMLDYFRRKGIEENLNLFQEFCDFHGVELTRNNGVYEADLTYYQYERLRTSVLVERVSKVESQPDI